jgi:hypothetical protein
LAVAALNVVLRRESADTGEKQIDVVVRSAARLSRNPESRRRLYRAHMRLPLAQAAAGDHGEADQPKAGISTVVS